MSLRQVFIQHFLSNSQSKYVANRKSNHLNLWGRWPDGDNKPHLSIPSGRIHHYRCWHSWLLRRWDLAPGHRELQAHSSCVTIRRWGDHTPVTVPYCSKISNLSQCSCSGDILLWVDKSSTYFMEHRMGTSPQKLISWVEIYPISE